MARWKVKKIKLHEIPEKEATKKLVKEYLETIKEEAEFTQLEEVQMIVEFHSSSKSWVLYQQEILPFKVGGLPYQDCGVSRLVQEYLNCATGDREMSQKVFELACGHKDSPLWAYSFKHSIVKQGISQLKWGKGYSFASFLKIIKTLSLVTKVTKIQGVVSADGLYWQEVFKCNIGGYVFQDYDGLQMAISLASERE